MIKSFKEFLVERRNDEEEEQPSVSPEVDSDMEALTQSQEAEEKQLPDDKMTELWGLNAAKRQKNYENNPKSEEDYRYWKRELVGRDAPREAHQLYDFLWRGARGGITTYNSDEDVTGVVGTKPGFEEITPIENWEDPYDTDADLKFEKKYNQQIEDKLKQDFLKTYDLGNLPQEDIDRIYGQYKGSNKQIKDTLAKPLNSLKTN